MAFSTLAAVAVAGTGYGVYAGERADKQQKRAVQAAKKAADADAVQRDIEFNRANAKRPQGLDALLSGAARDARGAQAGTMLTGPQGVNDPLPLGRKTLLGG